MPIKQNNKSLSFRAINSMKPGSRDLSDAGEYRGLRVSCGTAGTKSFFYRYRSPITERLVQMKLGTFPEMSLSKARQKLERLKAIRKSSRCPATEKRDTDKAEIETKAELQKQQDFTVESLIDLYLAQYIDDKIVNGKVIPGARKPKGQEEVRRTLYADPARVLGKKSASQVTRKDISLLVMGIVDRGANVQAGNVLRELLAAYEFAIGLDTYFDDDFVNPCIQAKAGLRQAKIKLTPQKGKRVLNDNELTQLLHWLPGSAYTPTQKNVIRMALWTGCRTGEVVNAEWQFIDLKKKTWHLLETKNFVERYVQLPEQAMEFLKYHRTTTGKYLFPSTKTGLPIQQKQLTEQAWRLRRDKKMLDINPWTPHDLRRSVRTGLSRLGCPSEVGEAVLGHSKKGIEGTYDLHQYESECRHWLQVWADHLDELVAGDNVIPINKKA
ncbi:MAG: site-specific integrase [Gammaproteobacteria bacterium]|nr:MAG: site-specific integrase [Gammaproteobacteria bacterium]